MRYPDNGREGSRIQTGFGPATVKTANDRAVWPFVLCYGRTTSVLLGKRI